MQVENVPNQPTCTEYILVSKYIYIYIDTKIYILIY